VPQVKFVDRTFNCSHQHAMAIWSYIKEHDNGVTNFHFEIAADILNEEELELLNTLRPGLVQLEIGVQSTNPDTIKEIRRTMDFNKLSQIVNRIKEGNNIHEHLDLIAGLPFEDYHSFIRSFNQVMSLKPEQLQLGFLKVLKGSFMYDQKEEYGLVYTSMPPYEVLFTKWLSFDDVLKLKEVEEMVETYYNSSQFRNSLNLLEYYFDNYFAMYKSLADFYRKSGYTTASPSRMKRYYILLEFVEEETQTNRKMQSDYSVLEKMKEQLTIDLYLRENLKSRPDFCMDLTPFKQQIRDFYKEESQNRVYLKNYEEFNEKQLMRMTHMDVIDQKLVLFDYQNRNPLTFDAKYYIVKSVSMWR
jgi:coproporphyrinogen III oxidase-like Fe-S oxidoreductase